MDNYTIYTCRNDLEYNENNNINMCYIHKNKKYRTIFFNNIDNTLKKKLDNTLSYYLAKLNIHKGDSIFIVGLGNDNYTADSIGPKTLKHININSYIKYFNINKETLVSSLEPGTLKETGILTEEIIKSVVNEIKPNLVILIDSYVSNNIEYLNRTIEIKDSGISTGIGINGLNSNIDYELLKTPIISIGVTTAVEVKFNNERGDMPYILSTKDIDIYVDNISKLIANSLNDVINDL